MIPQDDPQNPPPQSPLSTLLYALTLPLLAVLAHRAPLVFAVVMLAGLIWAGAGVLSTFRGGMGQKQRSE